MAHKSTSPYHEVMKTVWTEDYLRKAIREYQTEIDRDMLFYDGTLLDDDLTEDDWKAAEKGFRC